MPGGHQFTHFIHSLRFGPQLPDEVIERLRIASLPWTNHHLDPLDGTSQVTDDPNFNYMYFIKIVPTSYLPLGWQPKTHYGKSDIFSEKSNLGALGLTSDGSIESHQYSVTSHKRSMQGGDDAAEGHAERLHSRGGIPGVFFSYVRQLPNCHT